MNPQLSTGTHLVLTMAMPAVYYYEDTLSVYRHTVAGNDNQKLEQLWKDGTQYWLVPAKTAFHGGFLDNLKARRKAAIAVHGDVVHGALQATWEKAEAALRLNLEGLLRT